MADPECGEIATALVRVIALLVFVVVTGIEP